MTCTYPSHFPKQPFKVIPNFNFHQKFVFEDSTIKAECVCERKKKLPSFGRKVEEANERMAGFVFV